MKLKNRIVTRKEFSNRIGRERPLPARDFPFAQFLVDALPAGSLQNARR